MALVALDHRPPSKRLHAEASDQVPRIIVCKEKQQATFLTANASGLQSAIYRCAKSTAWASKAGFFQVLGETTLSNTREAITQERRNGCFYKVEALQSLYCKNSQPTPLLPPKTQLLLHSAQAAHLGVNLMLQALKRLPASAPPPASASQATYPNPP